MDTLTPSEQRIFTLGMICSNGGLASVKVDYDKLAVTAGLKNGASATVLFLKARRKVIAAMGDAASGDGTANAIEAISKTPKKSPNKVTKNTPKKTPAKGGKGKKATPTAAPKVESNDLFNVYDDDDEIEPADTPVKKEKFVKQEEAAEDEMWYIDAYSSQHQDDTIEVNGE